MFLHTATLPDNFRIMMLSIGRQDVMAVCRFLAPKIKTEKAVVMNSRFGILWLVNDKVFCIDRENNMTERKRKPRRTIWFAVLLRTNSLSDRQMVFWNPTGVVSVCSSAPSPFLATIVNTQENQTNWQEFRESVMFRIVPVLKTSATS